jgi:calcineurin-like phosphoesterase family protein
LTSEVRVDAGPSGDESGSHLDAADHDVLNADTEVDLAPFLSDLWITSDHHFGHVNIIRYCGRPFAGEPEQSRELARRWRDAVPWDAPLLHLGDLVMGPQDPALWAKIRTLPGRPRWLVRGNHDKPARLAGIREAGFQVISPPSLFYRGWQVRLTHEPIGEPLVGQTLNVHGHIHQKPAPSDHHINVSVEQTDYRPIPLIGLLDSRIDDLGSGDDR